MRGRRSGFKKTKRLFVVASEGAETERIYFLPFKPGRDGGFRLKVLPNPNHKSWPRDVLQRLIDYDASKLMPLVLQACERARESDTTPDAKWPDEQATWVYRLVERLR